MQPRDLLIDAFTRLRDYVREAVDGLTEDQLAHRVDPGVNSIAWLVWHLLRVQDDHVSEVAGHEQAWTSGGWVDRFGLPFDRDATGYGQSAEEVGRVRASAELLTGYAYAVIYETLDYLAKAEPPALPRVDHVRCVPPVTLGVRLGRVADDDLQHVGQAIFVRGVVRRG